MSPFGLYLGSSQSEGSLRGNGTREWVILSPSRSRPLIWGGGPPDPPLTIFRRVFHYLNHLGYPKYAKT